VGDFVSDVLADSVSGTDIMADCMAFVDSVSDCGYRGGGVSCAYKSDTIFAGQNTGQSREDVTGQ
jgi:hypothetical protein